MEQLYSGSSDGDTDLYHDNQELGLTSQQYQQDLNNSTAWDDQDLFHGSNTLPDFGGFEGDLQLDGPASQGDIQGNYEGFQGDSHIDSAASQGDVQLSDQGLQGDSQSGSADSQGYIQHHDQGFQSGSQASVAASVGDVQRDDQDFQGDSQFDSADETPVQRYERYIQRLQGLIPPQVESQAKPAIDFQEEIKNMKAGSVYRGLILNQAQYFSDSRISNELKELKRAGVVVNEMSDAETQYWAGRLFLAFKNVEDINDKNCKNGRPAQAASRLKGSYYPDKAIEAVCWRIVLDCSKCVNGIRLVEAHHATKVEQYDTFEERMEKVIHVCKTSKAACKQLLDPPYRLRLIDAPDNEGFIKENNRIINHKRDIQNLIGRQAMKRQNIKMEDLIGDAEPEEVYNSEDEDAESSYDSTPEKKKRTPATKRRSVSGRPPAKKDRLQPKHEESSPVIPLSLKRKRRTVSAKNYRQSDEDKTEDSDVSEYKEITDDVKGEKGSSSKRQAVDSSPGMSASPTPLARKSIGEKRLPSTAVVREESQDDHQPQVGSQSASPNQGHASGSGTDDLVPSDLDYLIVYEPLSTLGSGSATIAQGSADSGATNQLQGSTGPLSSAHLTQGASSSGAADQLQGSMGAPSSAYQRQGSMGSGAAHQRRGSMSLGSAHQRHGSMSSSSAYQHQGPMGFDFGFQPQGFMAPGSATQAQGSFIGYPSNVQPYSFMAPGPATQAQGATSSGFGAPFVAPRPASFAVPLSYEIPGPASDSRNLAKMEYKFIICEILNVHPQLAQYYTLEEFRMYARAYNLQFANELWNVTAHDGKKFKCKMFRLISPTNGIVPHFALYLYKLAFLAVSRGDLNPDATFNAKSPYRVGFSTKGDRRYDMALGVVQNLFGVIDSQTLQPRDDTALNGFSYDFH
ncbi:hypothetical protein N431DRAFT_558928 [Stipitochalara longipes BDJ]|nr:hypothetical protein N431DRAFT_558928 [Stipitochalara longipes BDJ]